LPLMASGTRRCGALRLVRLDPTSGNFRRAMNMARWTHAYDCRYSRRTVSPAEVPSGTRGQLDASSHSEGRLRGARVGAPEGRSPRYVTDRPVEAPGRSPNCIACSQVAALGASGAESSPRSTPRSSSACRAKNGRTSSVPSWTTNDITFERGRGAVMAGVLG
jgi:hypothetical protein